MLRRVYAKSKRLDGAAAPVRGGGEAGYPRRDERA
jgi:hypothetical protein